MSKMITITDDGHMLSSEPLHIADFMNITLSAQMQMCSQLVNQAPKDQQTRLKEELYDMYNLAASEFLKAFAPEIELRPDLTEEAILKAENELINKQFEQLEAPKLKEVKK